MRHTVKDHGAAVVGQGQLRRSVGVFGLTMISLGSIIGSGWLLGAYKAATHAGPASLLSWLLATVILGVLALIHAELGAAYPVAGGTARFPAFAFGRLAGFTAGWAAWLQAVTLAPIEVEASLTYLDNIGWAHRHLHLLNQHDATLTTHGLLLGTALMALFTVINLVGVKFLAESNSVAVVWKVAIPLLTIVVLLALSFHPGNFGAGGGFFAKGPQESSPHCPPAWSSPPRASSSACSSAARPATRRRTSPARS